MTFSTLGPKGRIYLDHNATTPLAQNIADKVPLWLNEWGNPGSIHQSGRGPKALIREARDKFAKLIGASPLELIFTSGGTEANNQALQGVFETFQRPELFARKFRNRYLVSSVEHPSLRKTAEYLQSRGAKLDIIPVSREGRIDLAAYEKLLGDDVALVSVMFANNETGNVFPIKKMTEMAHAHGALFHADCVQALGKVALNVRDLGVDLASFSGHKFYSMRGCGVLFSKRGVQLESLIHGGGQERHRRGGTENVVAIAALGEMALFASAGTNQGPDVVSGSVSGSIASRAEILRDLRDHFEARVLTEIPFVTVTGAESPRLPNTSSLIIPGVDGETLLMNLDMKGFAVSTGAACSSGSPEPSPVLLAMGLTRSEAQSSLRIGLGWSTTLSEINQFIETLKEVVEHLRAIEAEVRNTSLLQSDGPNTAQRLGDNHVIRK